tara:strand:+ start:799 stop:1908 length:1110 start_codon:yes stop_codon:yes gene_type:complete
MVAMPIIVLFFEDHGLTLTQIMTLQAIYSISVAIFEIPSGYIADVFGRKKSIILSSILCFLGYVIFSNFSNFYFFAFAEVLIGIGGSLMSGSDSALIYDSLLEENNKKDYTKIEGRNYAIGNFSESFAAILGGLLATTSLYLPVYIQTFVLFFSIPVAFSLVEPTIHRVNPMDRSIKAIVGAIHYSLFVNLKLRWLIIFSGCMGFATLSIAWFAQPLFKDLEIDIFYFGILWASLNAAAGVTSFNSHIFEKKVSPFNLMLIVSSIMIISFFLIGFISHISVLIFVFLIYLLRGVITPVLRSYINDITPSNKRATVLSIRSFFIRIFFASMAPIIGYIADSYDLDYAFYFIAIFVTFFSFLSISRFLYYK